MSTISVILMPEADGTVRLPVPEALRHGKVKVEATVEAAPVPKVTPQPGSLKGFWMSPDFDEPLEEFKEYMG